MSLENSIQIPVVDAGGRLMAAYDGQYTFGQRIGGGFNPRKADMATPPVPIWTDPGTQWAYWGDDDRLPTTMAQKVYAAPIAGAALKKRIDFMVGEGLAWYKTDDLRKNGADAEEVYMPEVDDWMENNRIMTEWFPAQCADFSLPFNAFSEIILSKDRSQVTGMYHMSAEHVRLTKASTTTNQVDFLQYSMHFPFGTAQNDKNRLYIPLYKWYDSAKFLKGLQKPKFAWHTRFHTSGLIYYARAYHLGLFKKDGWLDVSAQVPRIVSAMQKNQIALKYIISIPESYFRIRHTEWESYDPAKRIEIINKKVDEINQYLAGIENTGKSLVNLFRENEVSGQAVGKIEVVAIDDKAKTGTWVPDSFAADAQIVQGFGMDPSQIGLAPEGGKMGAGSGSDKMQSFNQHTLLNTNDQRLVLEPLNWISRYNKWGLTCMVKHTNLTTQNTNRFGIAPQAPADNNNP